MPSKQDDVKAFFIRMTILETQMKEIMSFQKYQMSALIAIGAALLGAWVMK
jgi:hypothetical protein